MKTKEELLLELLRVKAQYLVDVVESIQEGLGVRKYQEEGLFQCSGELGGALEYLIDHNTISISYDTVVLSHSRGIKSVGEEITELLRKYNEGELL